MSNAAIIMTPTGQAIFAALWDEYRASRAKPVSLAKHPLIMGHTRVILASPVVVQ